MKSKDAIHHLQITINTIKKMNLKDKDIQIFIRLPKESNENTTDFFIDQKQHILRVKK